MERARRFFPKLLRPSKWVLLFVPPLSFAALILIFAAQNTRSAPAYLIYGMSALYTFYAMTAPAIHLVKLRRLGSPILSAAKVLNLIAAMMSILGLQTAMISRFSENGERFRRMMNTITGGFIYGAVIVIAVYMLLHSRSMRKRVPHSELIGK